MRAKQREQVILVLLPAAVILAVYTGIVNLRHHRDHRREQLRFEEARKRAVSEQDLLIANTKLTVAAQERDTVQQALESEEAAIQRLCVKFGQGSQKVEVVEQIVRMLEQNRISLLAQATVTQPKISQYQQRILGTIEKRNGADELGFRRFELAGRYSDMHQFLRQLAESELGAFPISIQLRSSKVDDGEHSWELLVVM